MNVKILKTVILSVVPYDCLTRFPALREEPKLISRSLNAKILRTVLLPVVFYVLLFLFWASISHTDKILSIVCSVVWFWNLVS